MYIYKTPEFCYNMCSDRSMEVSVTSRPFRKLWQTDRPTDKQMYMKGHREVTLPIRKQWMTTLLVLDNGSYSSSSKMSLQVQCKHVQRWRITKRGESYISMLQSEHLFSKDLRIVVVLLSLLRCITIVGNVTSLLTLMHVCWLHYRSTCINCLCW